IRWPQLPKAIGNRDLSLVLFKLPIHPRLSLGTFVGNVIYERPVVKRGGADFVSQGSRTSPSPSASVDLAHLRPVRGRFRCAPRDTSSEPEAEGELPPSVPAVYEALTDVT